MKSLNRVTLIGNVGQDPESRAFANGDAITSFSLATSESWKDKNTGEAKEATEWHRCVAYRRLAEVVSEYVHKGDKLFVEGKIKTRKWTDKEGSERYSTEISVDNLIMLGGKNDASSPQQRPQQQSRPQKQPQQGFADFDDDIPFDYWG